MDEQDSSSIGVAPDPAADDHQPIQPFAELANALPLVRAKVQHIVESNKFTSFERVNYRTFSAEETADIRRFVQDTSLMISDLDHTLAYLSNLKESLEETKRTPSRLISAVSRVPVEILTTIFYLARPRQRSSHSIIAKGFNAYFNAAQVCRRWRSVALGMPRLWSLIHLHGATALQEGVEGQLEMLSRAAPLPPYLTISLPADAGHFLQKCRSGMLSSFESRCKGVEFYVVREDKYSRASFHYSKARRWLTRFSLLERLILSGCTLNVPSAELCTDWRNLTHLSFESLVDDRMRTFLSVSIPSLKVLIYECPRALLNPKSFFSRFPNLTEFFLMGNVAWTYAPFSHEQLERVYIGSCSHHGTADTQSFLPSATLPSLIELAIPISDTTEHPMEELLRRSNCPITCLQFLENKFWNNNQKHQETVAREIGRRLGVPEVRYDVCIGDTKMMRELKAKWYEWDYVMEFEAEGM